MTIQEYQDTIRADMDAYEYVSVEAGSADYQPLIQSTKDEGNLYVRLGPATQTLEPTAVHRTDPEPELPSDPSELPSDPSELPSDPSELPNNPSELPSDPSELPSDPSELPSDPSDLPSNPSELPSNPSELTMEHLANADPRQAQLWMLLQIQKMVQKMEDMYESAGYLRPPEMLVSAEENQSTSQNTEAKQPMSPPQPPSVPPQQSPVTKEGKEPPTTAESKENLPTRKELYVNLSFRSQKKGEYKPFLPTPPPPKVPPKTYKGARTIHHSDVIENEESSGSVTQQGNQDRKKKAVIQMYKKYPQQIMIGIAHACLAYSQ